MGTIDQFRGEHEFLSNFHQCPVILPGIPITFPSAEHAYQASKATSMDRARWVAEASTAREAKQRGRSFSLPGNWDTERKRVMLRVLMSKFSGGLLAARLLATGDAYLVEGNTWGDDYWGAVQGGAPPMPHWGHGWYGHNWLGRELMMVREVLG